MCWLSADLLSVYPHHCRLSTGWVPHMQLLRSSLVILSLLWHNQHDNGQVNAKYYIPYIFSNDSKVIDPCWNYLEIIA